MTPVTKTFIRYVAWSFGIMTFFIWPIALLDKPDWGTAYAIESVIAFVGFLYACSLNDHGKLWSK